MQGTRSRFGQLNTNLILIDDVYSLHNFSHKFQVVLILVMAYLRQSPESQHSGHIPAPDGGVH